MKPNRTLEYIRNFNFVERNHWQLMADLSNNDYDISYFGGRATICDNFEYFMQTIELFNIEKILEYLINDKDDCAKYYDSNGNNENYRGCLDELDFLIRFVKHEYCE